MPELNFAEAAAIDPFPPAPSVSFDLTEPTMTEAFEPGTVAHLCAAVVDLTGAPAAPPYAGLNDKETVFAGSMLKVCAMYAAFALRSRVQAFVDAAVANGVAIVPAAIIGEIEKAWKPRLRALFPARPATAFGNQRDISFPSLKEIFTFGPDGTVAFAAAVPAMTEAAIDGVGEFGAPKGGFHDWMRSMLRWSNNTAASKVILALGYHYLNGAIAAAGLFDAGNGLWISADYGGHDWVKTDAERKNNAAGQLLTERWATAQKRRRSNITATAAQAARFMTLMAQDKLVDATASGEMRDLMQSEIGGIGSYIESALSAVNRDFTTIASKIGFGDDKFSHDCGIVERTVDGKDLRYVVVGLGSAPARNRKDLSDLFVLLDKVIVKRNT